MSFRLILLISVLIAIGALIAQQLPEGPHFDEYIPPYNISKENPDHRKVSIIVPAYKEQPNLRPLCERVMAATKEAGIDAEMIIVDDASEDGSKEAVEQLHAEGYNISILVRTEKGLSTAVLAGFERAKYEVMLVMDADLQHPPESVPNLLRPLLENEGHFTLGSRYIEGGGTKDWALHRQLISIGATVLAWPLVSVSDPMSGFFGIRRSLYNTAVKDSKGNDLKDHLNPLGFKIALELMVKCAPHIAIEVPFVFTHRTYGESKLQITTQIQYLQHLASLYWYKTPRGCVAVLTLLCIILTIVLSWCVGSGGSSKSNARTRTASNPKSPFTQKNKQTSAPQSPLLPKSPLASPPHSPRQSQQSLKTAQSPQNTRQLRPRKPKIDS